MTVSRVLNDSPDVADTTREAVAKVIAESGFVWYRGPRGVRGRRHGLIDLVVPDLEFPYVLEIVRGFEGALEPTGHRLVLSSRGNSDNSERKWLAKIGDGSTDGAAFVLAAGRPARLDAVRRLSIPFVVIDHQGGVGSDVPSVGATNWTGARAATEYLISLGHRRIATIGGPRSYGCVGERLSGYRFALESAQVHVDGHLVRSGNYAFEAGYEQTLALLDCKVTPTAIFTGNDEQAFGCYAALTERGLTIPGDMSVVGFDDSSGARLVTPPLTTVRQPLADMGRVAARSLLRLVEGLPLDTARVELPCSLVIRQSCAPPVTQAMVG